MEKNFSLLGLNTFGFDVKARYFQELKSIDDIHDLMRDRDFIACRDAALLHGRSCVLIMSGGSNILFSNEIYDGFVIHPNLKGIEEIEENDETVVIRSYCGEVWKDFADYAVSKNLYGIENLSDIPGKVGAAPVQNIGAYGAEVKDTILRVHTIDLASGETKVFSNEECRFSYRNSIFKSLKNILIYAVDFKLKKYGELKLDYGNIRDYLADNNNITPTVQDAASTVKAIRAGKLPEVGVVGSVGSFFQNTIVTMDKYLKMKESYTGVPSYPVEISPLPSVARKGKQDTVISGEIEKSPASVKIPSGWLIDKAGWKGYRENHVGVWDKQALVLVHYGGGKPQEILDLMRKIQDSVYQKFGIEILPEVNIV